MKPCTLSLLILSSESIREKIQHLNLIFTLTCTSAFCLEHNTEPLFPVSFATFGIYFHDVAKI